MSEEEKKTLAELSEKKPENDNKNEDQKVEDKKPKDTGLDQGKPEEIENKSEDSGKDQDNSIGEPNDVAKEVKKEDVNVEEKSKTSTGKTEVDVDSLINTLSEKPRLSEMVNEKMAIKIEEKIEEHIEKEIKNSKSGDPIKFLLYSFGLGLIMVWLIWTVTLIFGMSK